MKILIDECLPRKLKRELPGHEVYTVPDMGWASKKNGELLRLMSEQFDAFLTIDSNFQYQQNLFTSSLIFIVLHTYSNRLTDLKPLMQQVVTALETAQPGKAISIRE